MTQWSRAVVVAPERLAGWITRFSRSHGDPVFEAALEEIIVVAPDGARARIEVPYGPLTDDDPDRVAALLRHLHTERTLGVLLVRRRAHAVGVFRGRELLTSAVGTAYVQGTTKAGGWSQQRYARRRANQARSAYESAADDAVQVLLPRAAELDAIVTGGDRTGLRAVLADPRLAPLAPLVTARLLSVPDPRRKVLLELPDQLLGVRIELNDLA